MVNSTLFATLFVAFGTASVANFISSKVITRENKKIRYYNFKDICGWKYTTKFNNLNNSNKKKIEFWF